MTVQEFLKGQLAWLAWVDAHHFGGVDSMVAVALVVRNRVRAGWHGGDWAAVIGAHNGYSALASISSYVHRMPDCRDRDFLNLLQKVDDVFSGALKDDYTAGGLYYCELHKPTREWFKQNVLANMHNHPRVASVGMLTFFS